MILIIVMKTNKELLRLSYTVKKNSSYFVRYSVETEEGVTPATRLRETTAF